MTAITCHPIGTVECPIAEPLRPEMMWVVALCPLLLISALEHLGISAERWLAASLPCPDLPG